MNPIALWPGSSLALVWIGFACVSLPLILALLDAVVFADRFVSRSSAAVERAAFAASDARLLADRALSLERRACQFRVLREAEVLENDSLIAVALLVWGRAGAKTLLSSAAQPRYSPVGGIKAAFIVTD
jgi:hypothetical protein